MYHAIVRSKVRKVFAALSAGDTGPMLHTLAPRFHYRFAGEHCLSGERTRHADIAAWWGRVFRLFPGARFDVDEVVVSGPPWNTQVATHVQLTARSAAGGDYGNEFVQLMRLRWGRATEVFTLEDTSRLERELERMTAAGIAEAGAAAIVSH
ncbi:MAG: nuclear transport factor 2 family protein [Acidimicrobiales bacterium]